MFKIYDGRESFFQWDLDRKLIVYDDSIKEVHFCNRTDDCSLVCETYAESGLTLVDVPNVLLQDNWRINVYAYDGKYTKHSEKFDVITRSKPADYVYTETECKRWEELENRVEEIENSVTAEGVEKAVEEYLKENPVEAGATEAQAAQIEANKADIESLENSLTNYYTKSDLDKGFEILYEYTMGEVNNALENTYNTAMGEVNNALENYYTKSETDTQILAVVNERLGVIENGTY